MIKGQYPEMFKHSERQVGIGIKHGKSVDGI